MTEILQRSLMNWESSASNFLASVWVRLMRSASHCSLTAVSWCMWNEFMILDTVPRKQTFMLQTHLCYLDPHQHWLEGCWRPCSLVLGSLVSDNCIHMGWEQASSFNRHQIPFKMVLQKLDFRLRVKWQIFPSVYQWKNFQNVLTWKIQAQKQQLGFQQVPCFFPCCPSGFIVTQRNQALPQRSSKVWK